MAKANKVSQGALKAAVPSIKIDTDVIVRDFASRFRETNNDDAAAALARRCTDKESFNLIRIASTAAWLETVKGYSRARAIANMDGSLQNPNGIIKTKEKRTATEQADYKTANSHWSDYLATYQIESLNSSKARKGPRKPRVPMGPPADKSAPPTNTVSAPPAPIAPQSFVASKLPSLNDVTAQVGAIVASLAQVGKANVANLKGDKGAAIRDLIAHNLAALKAIEAMEG